MRQSSGFEASGQLTLHDAGGHLAQQFSPLCAIMQPSWDSTTTQFTPQCYKWLEDVNRYESENGQARGTSVQSPLIGLPELNDNKSIIHTGDKPCTKLSTLGQVFGNNK
eukprot:1277265-Amphidinium_carterae.2